MEKIKDDYKCYGDTKDGNSIKFENEFFYPKESPFNTGEKQPSCSSGRQSKTTYKLSSYGGTIPESYRYFDNSDSIGGRESTDYCPISEYISSETYDIGHCSDKTKNIILRQVKYILILLFVL